MRFAFTPRLLPAHQQLLRKTVRLFAALGAILLFLSAPALATDWTSTYAASQSITMTIGQPRNYSIVLVAQFGGSTTTYPAVSGPGTTKTIAVGPGKLTFHVKYFDDHGNLADPAYSLCPGPILRFSFTSHGTNCAAYTDASISIQPGNAKVARQVCPDLKLDAGTKACSYTVLNDKCTVLIDRLNPVTPPTIFAKRSGVITVRIGHPSIFEALTLDWKASTIVVPPDSFSAAFAAVSVNMGKFIAQKQQESISSPGLQATFDQTINEQARLLERITLSTVLNKIAAVLQPPPAGACDVANHSDWAGHPSAWFETSKWKLDVIAEIDEDDIYGDLEGAIDALDISIETELRPNLDLPSLKLLMENQQSLRDAWAIRSEMEQPPQSGSGSSSKTMTQKLQALRSAIQSVPENGADLYDFVILGPSAKGNNDELATWTANYANVLAPIAKRLGADNYTPASYLSSLGADAPVKTALVSITVQYQDPQRVEVSTGVMVPLRPYHSYAAAAVAANGVPTGNVVQETLTYTVIPTAQVNVLCREWARSQRIAFCGTGAVGYNPATSAVEFGVGATFAWHSIEISGLADIGRDMQLAGGFTTGEPLAATNPAKPLTTTVWAVKPAIALSVRLPIGGPSK